MTKYEVWALAIDNNADDGYDDSLLGTFEDKQIAEWFFDRFAHNVGVRTPNTKLTLEKVERDELGNQLSASVLAEYNPN